MCQKKMKLTKKVTLLFMVLILPVFFFQIQNEPNSYNEEQPTKNYDINNDIKASYIHSMSTPLIIDDTGGGDYTWAEAALEDWCHYDGSFYLLNSIIFNVNNGAFDCITIRHSTVFFKIRDCFIFNTSNVAAYKAIYLYDVSNGFIINNTIVNCGYGIYLHQCDTIAINDNTIQENSATGIGLNGVDNSYIGWNTILKNDDGISLIGDNNSIKGNTININRQYGLYSNGFNNSISLNQFINNSDSGIYLETSIYSNIFENTLSVTGINLLNCQNNMIFNNNCTYANLSISICDISNISLNSLVSSGINLASSTNTIVSNNDIDFPLVGISLNGNSNSTITQNSIRFSASIGIHLTNEEECKISNNILTECGFYIEQPLDKLSSIEVNSSNLINGDNLLFSINQTNLRNSDVVDAGQIILYNCNNTLFSDLNYQKCSLGISFNYCLNNTLLNCNFSRNTFYGIHMHKCQNNNLLGNTINENGEGMYLMNCSRDIIQNNDVTYNYQNGIILIGEDNNEFVDNLLTNNARTGISFEGGDNNIFIDNEANDNGYHGIYFGGGNNNSFIGNAVSDNGYCGISFEGGSSNNFMGNIANNNAWSGISFVGGSSNNFTSNIANNNGGGISFEGGSYNNFIGNIANNNGYTGIYVNGISNILISDNSASNNGDTGLSMPTCDNSTIVDNVFDYNVFNGVVIGTCSFTSILRNHIHHIDDISRGPCRGISIKTGSYNNISENSISRYYYGMYLGKVAFDFGEVSEGISYNTLSKNIIRYSKYSIRLEFSNYNNFIENTLLDSFAAGFFLLESNSNLFLLNNVNGLLQQNGFRLEESNNNYILQNSIQNGVTGVGLKDSSFNNITGNIIINVIVCFAEEGTCESNIFMDNNCVPAESIFIVLKMVLMILGYSSIGVYAAVVIVRRRRKRS